MPQPTIQQRWSADTRTAFLLALELTGSTLGAAKAIGRKPAVCYRVRERDPDFAAAWDRIAKANRARRRQVRVIGPDAGWPDAAGAGAGGTGSGAGLRDAAGHRQRRDGFTVVKRRAFLRALSETASVAAACRAAGVSATTVQRLRNQDADFAAACEQAARVSAPTLRQIARERAVEGWEEPVFWGGKQVGTRRRWSERLLVTLLVEDGKEKLLSKDPQALLQRAKEAARAAGGEFLLPGTREDTDRAVIRMLDKIERRRGLPPIHEDPEVVRRIYGERGMPAGHRDHLAFRSDTDWSKVKIDYGPDADSGIGDAADGGDGAGENERPVA